ncbi:MAG: hypothetical protein FH748_09230 [Balneolaceae bacterium]|nr:hypothetical protein [Balneolaceae bacterium]
MEIIDNDKSELDRGILLLAYESDGDAIVEVALKLRRKGFTPFIIFGAELSIYQNLTWHDRCREHEIPFSTLRDAYDEYKSNKYNPDHNWLRFFEEQYCYSKSFNELIMTDPIIFRAHHNRSPYYKNLKPVQIYRWAECQTRLILRVFRKVNPVAVACIERSYFVKNVAAQIALSQKIPAFSLIRSRIGKYCFWHPYFGLGGLKKPLPEYFGQKEVQEDSEFLQEAKGFSDSGQALYAAPSLEGGRRKPGILKLVIDYLRTEYRAVRGLLKHLQNWMKGSLNRWSTDFSGSYLKVRVWHFLRILRSFSSKISKIYDILPGQNEPFILVPLHVLPESSTLTLGPEYYELNLVRKLSERIPPGINIYVKENPGMISLRTKKEIALFRELPNVYFVSPYLDTSNMLNKAAGVMGISGTALLEGALLGKPVLAVGSPEFASGISHYTYNELDDFLSCCQKNKGKKVRIEKVFGYLERISSEVFPLDFHLLFQPHKNSDIDYSTLTNRLMHLIKQDRLINILNEDIKLS